MAKKKILDSVGLAELVNQTKAYVESYPYVPLKGGASISGNLTIESAGVTDLQAGNLIVNGSSRFINTINADISGNSETATKLASKMTLTLGDHLSGNVQLDGSQNVTLNATIKDNSHLHTSANISDATNANTGNMIVKRDASGNFSAGTITANLNGTASYATQLKNSVNITVGNTTKGFSGKDALSFTSTEIGYRHEWNALIKCATWSRLCYVAFGGLTIGSSFLLNIAATRNNVVYHDTYLIKTHHSLKANITKLNGSTYTNSSTQIRVCCDSNGNCYVELYDNVNSATNSTTQIVFCRLIPILIGNLTKYTVFTDGTNLPSGFSVGHSMITDTTYTTQGKFAGYFKGTLSGDATSLTGLTPTITELNYVKGVTSGIQEQLAGKSSSTHNHDSVYLKQTGGTMSGTVNSSKSSGTFLSGNQGAAIINSTAASGSYSMLAKMNSTNGYFTQGSYLNKYLLQYTNKATVDAGTNGVTKSVTLLDESGNTTFPGTVSAPTFSGDLKGSISGYTLDATEGFTAGYKNYKSYTIPSETTAKVYYIKLVTQASRSVQKFKIRTLGNNTNFEYFVTVNMRFYMTPEITVKTLTYNDNEITKFEIRKNSANTNYHDLYAVIESATTYTKTIYIWSDQPFDLDAAHISATVPTQTIEREYVVPNANTLYTSIEVTAPTFKGDLVGVATKATKDSNGQQISSTYIKDVSASGTTLTLTKGDGSTSTTITKDTLNTAGSTNSTSKLFIIGTTSQGTNPQTYSRSTCYIGTDGCLYSNNVKVSDINHVHTDYATWTGGLMSKGAKLTFLYDADSRFVEIYGNGLKYMAPPSATAHWASGLNYYDNTGENMLSSFGLYSIANVPNYYFFGTYDKPLVKIDATSGKIASLGGFVGKIEGNATSASLLANYYPVRQTSANLATVGDGSIKTFKATSTMTEGKPPWDAHMLHFEWDNAAGYNTQLALQDKYGEIATRGMDSGTWGNWRTFLNSVNYTDYTVTKTGSGASGNWNINALTATTLQTARTINGTAFNGGSNITTTTWGAARTFKIGNTSKSINGAGNYEYTLSDIGAVNKAGDTLTGFLTLHLDPTANLHAATKQYVDNSISRSLSATDYMHFKGTVGTGGNITAIPTTGVKVGDSYKIISVMTIAAGSSSDGTAHTAKLGDTVVATATTPKWAYIPSGDERETLLRYSTTETPTLTTSANTGTIILGEAAIKQVDTSIASGSTSVKLPTTAAVAAFAVAKNGDTWTGIMNAKGSMSTDAYTGALNMNNSNIYGINSLIFADLCETAGEGIQFWRSATAVDSLWGKNGVLYFTPNRTLGGAATDYTVLHSGNYTDYAAPKSHASSATTYGIGTSSLFGHVKLSDTYTSVVGAASTGIAPSQSALFNAYTALNNKFPNYLPLTGSSVMKGDIVFSNNQTAFRGISGTIAGDDYWRVGGVGPAYDQGYLELATGDGANEPIYVRQYTGVFTTLKRTATILDSSGNTEFPGTVTAPSIDANTVKVGGCTIVYDSASSSLEFRF